MVVHRWWELYGISSVCCCIFGEIERSSAGKDSGGAVEAQGENEIVV